jgi:serine/threonine protein phosphatase 1
VKILKRSAPKPVAEVETRSEPARFPSDRVGFAIGDIHGRADLLTALLNWIEDQTKGVAGKPIIIFLGDYIDRGGQSAAVLDLLTSDRLKEFETRFLRGNHEDALLTFLRTPVEGQAWLDYGGLDTLTSYGVEPPTQDPARDEDLIRAAELLRAAIPASHLDFMKRLEPIVFYGDYAFAHAGVDPASELTDQNERDLLWIRDRFLNDKVKLSHVVVHGHTPAVAPYRDRRRIGLDTMAHARGVLTCARFSGADVSFYSTTPSGDVRSVEPMRGA